VGVGDGCEGWEGVGGKGWEMGVGTGAEKRQKWKGWEVEGGRRENQHQSTLAYTSAPLVSKTEFESFSWS